MAIYASAVLVKEQHRLIGAFQSNELRFRTPEIHNLFLKNTNILLPTAEQARKREDSPNAEFNYAIRQSRTLGTARASLHTGAQGDSGILTPSWSPYTDKFASTLKEADGKVFSLQEMHFHKMQDVLANFAEQEDTAAASYLFSNRSGVNVATTDGTFDAVDDVFKITEATNGNQAIEITKMVMNINKYQGVQYDIVCDAIAFRKFKYLANQGNGNSVNTSFQFGGVNFVLDISLGASAAGLVGAYANGSWIVVPQGSVACPNWIPMQNRLGVETTVSKYASFLNPVDNLNYALHTYETNADSTALGGYLQDVKIETEVSIDLAYTHAPLSTASESPLMMFAFI